jgi:hypothetical protein
MHVAVIANATRLMIVDCILSLSRLAAGEEILVPLTP